MPIRQGFAAALVRPDGSAIVASSVRWEQAVLYAVDGDRVVVGLHPRDVIRRLRRPPALDLAKLADLVALHDDAESTVFAAVRRVPMGAALHLEPGRTPRIARWWHPDTQQDRSIRSRDAAALVRDTIRDAVAASLPDEGDVAATLSGGLDSSMVVGTAAAVLAAEGRRILAMTHAPLPGTPEPGGEWEVDDAPYAAAMADSIPGIDWEPVVNTGLVTPLTAEEWSIRRTWHPSFNPLNQVWLNDIVRRAEQAGAPLLLTGSSGNALFSRESAGILRGLGQDRQFGALLRQVRARHRHTGTTWSAAARGVAREALPPAVLDRIRARRGTAPLDRANPLGAADLPIRRERVGPAALDMLRRLEAGEESRRAWLDFALADCSRFGQAQNVSSTVWWSDPLSDQEVVELALRLPEEAWIANGWDRGLARAAGEGLIPDRIRWRTKYGAQGGDVATWVAGQESSYRELLERMRASPSVAEFVDLDALGAAIGPGLHDPSTALLWQGVYGRAFALGQFALWYEEEVLDPAARGEWPLTQ